MESEHVGLGRSETRSQRARVPDASCPRDAILHHDSLIEFTQDFRCQAYCFIQTRRFPSRVLRACRPFYAGLNGSRAQLC